VDVASWLRNLGLEQYEAAFRENAVGPEVLCQLTTEDLKELGVAAVGHRRQLMVAIASLRPEGTPAGAPGGLPSSHPATSPTGSLVSSETTAERRPLSVMFCDLIGSTALSSRLDPEDLRDVIRTYQACVANTIKQFDGFIARYVGDGVLIYFGWPEARETDAERAVRAGLAVAAAVSGITPGGEPLHVRVGIATGLVVIGEPIGSGDSRQQTAVGETPNLAARLQGLAGPDQVVIDAATRRQIGGLFECQDLGTVELKGLPVAVPVWQVLGEGMLESRFEALRPGATPLIGRNEEMELLLRRWAQAKAGSGRVVLISAEPGVGKSRLAEAIAQRIAAEPHVRLRYFCSPHHQDSALYPVIAQMERAAGFLNADAPTVRLAKLQAMLATTAPPVEEVALIAELVSLPSADLATPLDVTPQRKKDTTFEALLRQIEGLSRRQPLLMMFDDLHWIDPSSRELLDRAIERVADWPVLLLMMFRPEFQPPWAGQPHVTMLTLARLDRHDTAAMVANVAGDAKLPPEVAEEIAERTDGVPLFVEELTKAVLEVGVQAPAALSSMPHPALSVPATLHASLMARLDRLGSAAKEVAQTGAAIGREFGFGLLASSTDLPEPQLREALDRLTSVGLVFVRGTPPGSSYIFKHALVQDAAYSTLLRGRRRALHRKIGEAMEAGFPEAVEARAEVLAHHFTEGEQVERAIEFWMKAGRYALMRSGMKEAEALLRKGLGSLASLPDDVWRQERELDLQIVLGKVLMAAHGFGARAVGDVFSRAHRLCNDLNRPDKLLPILWGRWVHHLEQGDLGTAQRIAGQMRQLGDVQNDDVIRVMGHCASGSTCMFLGDFATARDNVERGLSLYEPAHRAAHAEPTAVDVLVDLLGNRTWILACLGYLDQAQSCCDWMLAEARRLAHAHTLGFALWWGWVAHWFARSDPADLLAIADELLALSIERGFAFLHAVALVHRGWSLAALGRANDGITLLSEGLAGFRAAECTNPTPPGLTMLADADRSAGQLSAGLAHLMEAERVADATQIMFVQAETLRLSGDLLLAGGDDPAVAEPYYERSIALAQRQGAKLFELRSSTSLARLWRDQGKRAEARDLLAPIYHWFTEGFDAPDLKDAKALLDELA
jgi:class 3 adenylate cyclase/tetratricopeptide (TPR) repeat protein